MPTKIGHFEILSELAKSPTGAVYKANDPESGQTVALKAIQLSAYGENATALEQALLAEAEKTKALNNPNVTPVYGAGEIEGQFCAAMEYVQGNSIATMLARKEGFSIWDLLDIGRQLCSGLDHAASHNVVHYSLEPAKIMCGWDGTVKILSYGMSSTGNFAHQVSEGLPTVLHYTSPEQVQGQPMDARSNLFSLGAMFYEMVTERKAFDRDDIESLRQSIVESTPVPPIHVNPKVHPLLSGLIMKALAKDPAERFQSGRELLDELEKCKESKTLAAKKPEAAKGPAPNDRAKAAAQSKFVGSTGKPAAKGTAAAGGTSKLSASTPAPAPSSARASGVAPARAAEKKSAVAASASKPAAAAKSEESQLAEPVSRTAAPKAAAAAAGVGGADASSISDFQKSEDEIPEIDLSDSFITASVKATIEAAEQQESAQMSAAVADEPEVETFEPQEQEQEEDRPKIAVDPMMAGEGPAGSSGTSFSEISELPPLKEAYVAPPPPPPVFQEEAPKTAMPSVYDGSAPASKREEKPKVQPREVAQKAIKEVKSVPPKLFGYALGGAAVLILAIGIGVTVYIHSQNSEDDAGTARPAAETSTQPEASQPASKPAPPVAQSEPTPAPVDNSEPESPAAPRSHGKKKAAPPPAPVIIPGQMALDSTPQGAQVQVDGHSDASYVTPFALNNLPPGPHTITTSKSGFSTDTRSVTIISGTRATIVVHLSQLMATLVVNSDPAGANVYIDGRDTGVKTPGQVSVDKGQHLVLIRKMGYIDETQSMQFVLGQTFNFSPALRALGSVDNMRTVGGKMSKLFGGKSAQAGQTIVSIHTTPKGAQVAINQHIMDKNSPLDVALDPGNYVIDITLTGYAPVHKVVTVNNGGKLVVDEVLQAQ